jgi:hypothetical protein
MIPQLAAPVEFWVFTAAVVGLRLLTLAVQALVDHWNAADYERD